MSTKCVVIGRGRAGFARVRSIQNNHLFQIENMVAGRDFDTEKIQDCDLVFVCTENGSHYDICLRLLQKGCGVVVEYPPCENQLQWRTLTHLAEEKRCYFYCGLIGLHSSIHQKRKEWIRNHPHTSMHVQFEGGLYRWVEKEAKAKHCAQLAFGRLAAIWDICGPLTPIHAIREEEGGVYRFSVQLQSELGCTIQLDEVREEGRQRHSQWRYVADTRIETNKFPKEDLFAMDLDRIQRKEASLIDIDSLFACMDSIQKMVA